MRSDTAIEVEGMSKVYPTGKKAVDELSFQVGQGEIFGLLGPNGSGKTTTVRVLVTLLKPSSGLVRIGGFDVQRDKRDIRKIIGYAAQAVGIDDDLTARENLLLQARLHGLTAKEANDRTTELFEVMGLASMANVRTMRFSGGMRRRVDLIAALVHRPPILFLDEPTTGMDPQSRIALWQYLDQLKRQGMTILLTTQYLEEADKACDRIAIIDNGQLLRVGSPAALKDELGADRITLTLTSPLNEDAYDRAAQLMAKNPDVSGVEQVEPLVLSVRETGGSLPQILRQLESEGIQIQSIRNASITLDDVFITYTGHKIKTEVDAGPVVSAAFAAAHGGKLPQ
jgi:daunorubicin resistance ABC transporter ATP-binding subunit